MRKPTLLLLPIVLSCGTGQPRSTDTGDYVHDAAECVQLPTFGRICGVDHYERAQPKSSITVTTDAPLWGKAPWIPQSHLTPPLSFYASWHSQLIVTAHRRNAEGRVVVMWESNGTEIRERNVSYALKEGGLYPKSSGFDRIDAVSIDPGNRLVIGVNREHRTWFVWNMASGSLIDSFEIAETAKFGAESRVTIVTDGEKAYLVAQLPNEGRQTISAVDLAPFLDFSRGPSFLRKFGRFWE